MNKRQLKKRNESCPECLSTDGIVGKFKRGKKQKHVFLYCEKCGYEYIFKKLRKKLDLCDL